MTDLQQLLDEYLATRRALGVGLKLSGSLLRRFVAFVAQCEAAFVTTELALQWATEPRGVQPAQWANRLGMVRRWVRLFFVEEFSPYSWAFLPADASLQCSFRGDSNQASTYLRLSGGQPSLETVPNTVGLSPSGALPSGHSRGVLVRFHGQGDRPVMAVTTGFQGRRFDVPEARTGVPRIDLPSPAPCAAADAVFADAKAFLSSNEGAHSRFPGHALTPTGVMAIRCKQFHLPDL